MFLVLLKKTMGFSTAFLGFVSRLWVRLGCDFFIFSLTKGNRFCFQARRVTCNLSVEAV